MPACDRPQYKKKNTELNMELSKVYQEKEQLEKENEKLKKENEKLKKQLEEVSQKEKEWWEKAHNELYEKYKKLERENRITFGAWQYEVGTLKKLEAWKYEVIQTAKAMDWDLPEEDEDEKECGVDGFRCEECEECNRTRVCDACECVGGCYEHCPYLTGKWNA